ncbi:MAG: hypothetical protein FD126_3213, partial [Elusimicrobia bacterium]
EAAAPAGEPIPTPHDMEPPPASAPAPAAAPKKAGRKAAGRSPKSLKAARTLAEGRAAERAQQFSRAVALYEKATKQDPSSADAFFHLGNAYFGRAFQRADRADRDDAQAAVDAYETALGIDPTLKSIRDPFLLYHGLSQSYETVGAYQKALGALKMASKNNPNNPMPHLYGARVRMKMGDTERASANLYWSVKRARALNMFPQLARMLREDAVFAGLMGIPQSKVILDSYDAVYRGAITEDQAKERIRNAAEMGDMRDAVRDVPNSRTSRPGSMDAPVTDPVVLQRIDDGHRAFEAGNYQQAVTDYQSALTADGPKGTMDAVLRSMTLERLGSSYRHMGLAGEGVRALTRAIETLPENSAAHYELALCLAAGGRPGEALSALNRALDTAGTLAQLRKTLILSKTDPELASVRDIPRYRLIVESHERKMTARR